MKRDPEDDRLALGMDVLAPEGYGEIIGGGERATDLAFLQRQVDAHNLPREAFEWYFDLRDTGLCRMQASGWAWSAPCPGYASWTIYAKPSRSLG